MRVVTIVMAVGPALYASVAAAQSYNNSPYNYQNSEYNYANSPYNYRNSPYNYQNSPYNPFSTNGIYDNNGDRQGYAVPRSDGGVNFFDNNGNRLGYTPGR